MRGNGSGSATSSTSREQLADHGFGDLHDAVLIEEGSLDIELGELGLAVGAQVFVAEALARSGSRRSMPDIINNCLNSCGDCGSAKKLPGWVRLGTR